MSCASCSCITSCFSFCTSFSFASNSLTFASHRFLYFGTLCWRWFRCLREGAGVQLVAHARVGIVFVESCHGGRRAIRPSAGTVRVFVAWGTCFVAVAPRTTQRQMVSCCRDGGRGRACGKPALAPQLGRTACSHPSHTPLEHTGRPAEVCNCAGETVMVGRL